jgi:hypothetical protein
MNEKQIFPSFGGVAKGRGGWPDVLICALFLFALLSSCKCNGQANSPVVQDDRIGILHNQLLDTVYNDLMKEQMAAFASGDAAKRMTAEEQADLAYNSLRRGIKNLLPDVTDAEIDAYMSKEKFDAGIRQKMNSWTSLNDKSSNNELQHLTPFQQKYYEELMQRIKSKGASPEQVLEQIAEMEAEIVKNSPTTEEAEQLLQITSTARYSIQYWVKNINKWSALKARTPQSAPKAKIIDRMPPGTYPYPDPNHPEYYIIVPDDESSAPFVQRCPDGQVFNPKTCACTDAN